MMTEAKIYRHWSTELDHQHILWLNLNKADTQTNVLSREVMTELDSLLTTIEKQPPAGIIFTSAKVGGFIAGADVSEFSKIKDEDTALQLIHLGQSVLNRIAALKTPTLALIHGFCLGGGLELALACRYRVALDAASTRLGLPEVRLGIHPGFGGTVRLPPLVGALVAMDLMLGGQSISANAARKIGLVDHAVPQRHFKEAAIKTILSQLPPHKAKGLAKWSNSVLVRPLLSRYLRKKVAEKAPAEHYPAPYATIDLWNKFYDDPKKMMAEEARSCAQLLLTDTSQNLVHVFFLQEQLKSLGKETDFKPRHVHVIGAGVMGGDIAVWCALQGLTVTVQDRTPDKLASVFARAHKLYAKKLKQPRLIEAALDRLIPDPLGYGLKYADVVIEAVIEDIEVKKTLFREIEQKAKSDALLATNTSSIRLELIGAALQDKTRLVGLHFFNPVAKMQLVEIVKGEQTSPEQIKRAAAFAKLIDRLPLPVVSSPGFLVNRILMPYLLEAVAMVGEGIQMSLIDKIAVDFGMPMGPIALADSVGLDICLAVADVLTRELGGKVPQNLRDLVAAGHLGKKSGQGFYHYKGDKIQNPALKVSEPTAAAEDIQNRLILRLLNEAAACLREKVVENSNLLDAGIIFGTGFAPFRGGPLRYAESLGKSTLRERLSGLKDRFGDRFTIDAGWKT